MTVSITLTVFTGLHFYMIFRGLSTIELREKQQDNLKKYNKASPYSLSLWSNFTVIFGNNPLFWFLPISILIILMLKFEFLK